MADYSGIMRNPLLTHVVLAALLFGAIQRVGATVRIDVGTHYLLPDTPQQRIPILVTSTESASDPLISGINLLAEIGDGTGPNNEPGFDGTPGGVEAIDLTGSLFGSAIISGQAPIIGFPQLIEASWVTETNVLASGVLMNLIIDTTGFQTLGDFYPLRLTEHVTPFPLGTELLGPIGSASPIELVVNNGQIILADDRASSGDFNQDGLIDAADYTVWRDTPGFLVPNGTGADGDRDGEITQMDLAIWEAAYGSTPAQALSVPEPSSAVAVAVAIVLGTIGWQPTPDAKSSLVPMPN